MDQTALWVQWEWDLEALAWGQEWVQEVLAWALEWAWATWEEMDQECLAWVPMDLAWGQEGQEWEE